MADAALPHSLRSRNARVTARNIRLLYKRLVRDPRRRTYVLFTIVLICFLGLLFYIGFFFGIDSDITAPSFSRKRSSHPTTLFIAIGSAPGNFALRNAARQGWLRWLPSDGTVSYRFFSDTPPVTSDLLSSSTVDWSSLRRESKRYKDVVLQPLPTGYGSNEHNLYSQRARFQAEWTVRYVSEADFFLRIDDDSFLCLHRLLYELKALPRSQLFWGRFWCREGRNRADENFMLFSRDIVELLADERLVGKLLPYDDQVTLGWNFGYWSWVLNFTVFDDQKRLDAQQGYLTKYMHQDSPADTVHLAKFCENFIYAHHVKASTAIAAFRATKTHLMYPLPVITKPVDTCDGNVQTFVPARHSRNLPDLRIGRSGNIK